MYIIKKYLCLVLTSILIFSFTVIATAENNDSIKICVNNNVLETDVNPLIIDGRTMVPMRAIFEALGLSVAWDSTSKTITSEGNDTIITMAIGDNSMTVNGVNKELDVGATIVNDRTLVPVRAIAESLNCKVDWDSETRTVNIISINTENTSNTLDEMKDRINSSIPISDSFKYNPSIVTLKEGETLNLTPQIISGKCEISKYSISNTDIIKLKEDGYIEALSKGSSIITAYTSTGASASCTIIVEENTEEESYTITPSPSDSITLKLGESQKVKFTANTDKFEEWRLETSREISYESGKSDKYSDEYTVTGKNLGAGYITMTCKTKSGESVSSTVNIKVVPDGSTLQYYIGSDLPTYYYITGVPEIEWKDDSTVVYTFDEDNFIKYINTLVNDYDFIVTKNDTYYSTIQVELIKDIRTVKVVAYLNSNSVYIKY